MPSWVERWQTRRRELAEGADADLIRANRKKFRVALSLIALAIAVTAIDAKFGLLRSLDIALRIMAVSCFVIGLVIGRWARAEREFLNRPDSEGPPEIFKSTS